MRPANQKEPAARDQTTEPRQRPLRRIGLSQHLNQSLSLPLSDGNRASSLGRGAGVVSEANGGSRRSRVIGKWVVGGWAVSFDGMVQCDPLMAVPVG
jgi:hypothetical protein